jgi:hypothetical protein
LSTAAGLTTLRSARGSASVSSRPRPVALEIEKVLKVFACGRLRRSNVSFGSVVWVLSSQRGSGQKQAKRDLHEVS